MQLFVRGRILPEARNPINRVLIWIYRPVIRLVLRIPFLRDIPPRMIALGIDRPHVESPARDRG